jgi:hypothetical protein
MKDERRFYVYSHSEVDTGRIFYIGKGSGRRAFSDHSRSSLWKAIASVHGFHPEILADGLSEKEAYDLEIAFTEAFEPGELAAVTRGGPGARGYRHTDSAKKAISEFHSGRKLSDDFKKKLSETIRSRPDLIELRRKSFLGDRNPSTREKNRIASSIRMKERNPTKCADVRKKMSDSLRGRIISHEARGKISIALRGRKRGPMPPQVAAALEATRLRRPVITACGLRFESTLAAAKALGLHQGSISNNCAGRQQTAGGYVWSYAT